MSESQTADQRGYIDFSGAFYLCFAAGVLAGAFVFWALPRLWRLIKPWLHSVTG